MSTYLRCSGCQHVFSSERAFVTHRIGSYARGPRQPSERRCLRTADELRAAGLVENGAKSRGARVVWSVAARIESWSTHRAAILMPRDTKYAVSEAPGQPAAGPAAAVA